MTKSKVAEPETIPNLHETFRGPMTPDTRCIMNSNIHLETTDLTAQGGETHSLGSTIPIVRKLFTALADPCSIRTSGLCQKRSLLLTPALGV